MNLTETIKADIEAKAKENTDAEIVAKCLLKNPYTKEHFNLTLQCEIASRIPAFAEVLETRAEINEKFDDVEKMRWIDVANKPRKERGDDCAVRSYVMNGKWSS